MNEKTTSELNAEKRNAEAKAARLLGMIVGGFIVLSIGGMMVFDMYGEKQAGSAYAPSDAADR